MGIRIHKMMGYSLSLKEVADLVCNPDMSWAHGDFLEDEGKWREMCDEILSSNFPEKDARDPFFLERMSLERIRDNGKIDASDYSLNELKNGGFWRHITYNNEFGCSDTVLFQPLLASKDWSRYDNPIDYIESSLQNHSSEPQVIRHNRCLYPFISLMRENPDGYLGIEQYWEPCYLDNPKYKDAIPTCTFGVMMMLKYMKMVPEDKLSDAIMLFRPTIYTYWS